MDPDCPSKNCIKVETPSEGGLYRQLVENNDNHNFLKEELLDINSLVVDGDDEDKNKFNAAKKVKMQKRLRVALRNNYEQKIFLKLAKEHGYEAAEACNLSESLTQVLQNCSIPTSNNSRLMVFATIRDPTTSRAPTTSST